MSKSLEIDNTRKHYEPRLYLQGFTIPDRSTHIYVFDKQQPGRGIWNASTKDVSVSNRAYTVENEKHLTEREKVYSKMLKILLPHVEANGDCKAEDIDGWEHALPWFADFVLTSLLRSSGRLSPDNPLMQELYADARERNREFWEQQDPESIERLSTSLNSHGSDLAEFREFMERQSGLDDIRRWIPLTIDPVGRTPWFDDIRELLIDGNWTFHRVNTDSRLITGDNPVIGRRLGPKPEHQNFVFWYMPLSAHVLVAVTSGDVADRNLIAGLYENQRHVELQNLIQLENSTRFVYASSEHELDRAIRWNESGLSPLRDDLP